MKDDDTPFDAQTMFELRGRQSVRATFKLSQKAIDAIGLVAVHMGIKQKSLFDHIIEDTESLDDLAQAIRIQQFRKIPRKQKTFVLSRKSIESLSTISQAHEIPRDALVEYSIKKLEQIISTEKTRHQERKKFQAQLVGPFQNIENLYISAAKELGQDDPFCQKLEKSIITNRKTLEDLASFLEKSQLLEEY